MNILFKLNGINFPSNFLFFRITELVFTRFFDTFRRIEFFYKFTEMYRNEKRILKVLHGFTDRVINSRRNELINGEKAVEQKENSGIKRKKALLDVLLEATVDGKRLSNEDIREEVDTFMFEGHDTTTSGISFCLFNIAKYPEVQRKIFEEIETEVGMNDNVLTLQNLNQLHYLELVVKESLRLYPSVPYFARKLTEEITINDFTLPKDLNLVISPYLMGRDPNIFSDPLEFNPERFNVETTSEVVNPYAYVPFSAGPRNCIGQKFAVYEMKSIICKIIRSFELSVSKEHEPQVFCDLVLKTENGIILNIRKRNFWS